MGNLTTAMVFVLALNVLMFLTQASVQAINPEANIFFTCEGHMLDEFDKNSGSGEPVLDTENTYNNLPSGEGSVSPTTGNFFTDVFSSAKNWFAKKTGLSYLAGIVSAPYNMLKAMGLPNAFSFAMGTLWYALTFFLIVGFILGRDS